MRYATQNNGTTVVVKLLRPGFDELLILQHLHLINSPDNHTIPLIGTLNLNVGTFIVLPEAILLGYGFEHEMFRSEIADFSRQLVEGVAFLHSHGIAYLDIKPQNIVALRKQLLIIDFNIVVRVDTLIDRWRGTPGWMAPEIGKDPDGPKCLYSPIRADLWSCGPMLRYLESKGAGKEEALARDLLNKDPQLRPLLYVQSSVTVGHSLSELQGLLKRKPDDLPHDAKRLAIT
jgi:serine/threonine protein kinase